MQLEGRGETSPALFEKQKKCPDIGKKDLDCFYLWVKFAIQNVVLRVSRRKKRQNISLRGFFFLFFFLTKCLLKCHSFTNHASGAFRILAYSALCFFRYIKAYSIMFSIKTYSRILRHY